MDNNSFSSSDYEDGNNTDSNEPDTSIDYSLENQTDESYIDDSEDFTIEENEDGLDDIQSDENNSDYDNLVQEEVQIETNNDIIEEAYEAEELPNSETNQPGVVDKNIVEPNILDEMPTSEDNQTEVGDEIIEEPFVVEELPTMEDIQTEVHDDIIEEPFIIEEVQEVDEQTSDSAHVETDPSENSETEVDLNSIEELNEGPFFAQGQNDLHFEGTCGLVSSAHSINALLDTNEFNENDMVTLAVENELCEVTEDPELSGGTTTNQMMELYDKVNEQNPDIQIETELHEFDNALSVEEMAEKLDEGSVLQVAVDSAALWDQERNYEGNGLLYGPDFASDHWISVTGVDRVDGVIEGFNVIDSGGGVSYLDANKFHEVCFGTDDHKVIDPTSIVVHKI